MSHTIRMYTVASRHGRPPTGSSSGSKADLEVKADETARTIAGLRERLWQPDLIRHPRVNRELQAFLEQLAVLVARVNPRRGRHSTESGPDEQPASKPPKSDLEPNPLAAATAAEFVEVLRQYKAWNGNPSWRSMAARANQTVVFSTMYSALNSDALPKFEVMKAIIIGCGGGEKDLEEFTAAWRRIDRHSARQVTEDRI
jgi:hypothetical protein